MAGSREIHQDKPDIPVPPAGADHHTANQAVAHDIYKPPGEKPGAGKDDTHKGDTPERSVGEKVCDEAYHLWKSATSWFGSGEQKPEEKGNGAKPAGEKSFLECSDPYKAGDHKDQQGGEAKPEDRTWFQRAKDWTGGAMHTVGEYFTSAKDFVENGYQKATTVLADAWSTVIKGKEYQDDVQVVGKMHDGKTTEVMVRTDNDTRQLTADEVKYKDSKGNTIIENRKTHEITSQSADGKTVYQRRADGTEVVRDQNGEVIRDKKNHTFTKIDNDGTITEFHADKNDPENTEVITKLNDGFKIAQMRAGFSWKDLKGEEGQSTTFTDGVGHIHRHGVRSVVHRNGDTELQDDNGHGFRVHNGQLEHLDKDGTFKPVKDGDPEMKQVERKPGGGWRVMGVDVDSDGSITGESGEKIQKTPDGGISITGTDGQGRPVHAAVHEDGSSEVIDGKGAKTVLDPNHPDHLIQRFDCDGKSEITYDEDNGGFSLDEDGVEFYDNWTDLDFCDADIFDDGSIWLEDENEFLVDAAEDAYDNAGDSAAAAVQVADSACSAAVAEVSNGTCDFGDVSNIMGAIGDLNNALGVAMAAGNLDAINQIIMKKSQLEGVLGDVQVRAQVASELQAKGITDPSSVADAQAKLGTQTVEGVVNQEQRELGKAV